ncbi:MAG: hypothetical protein FGM14_01245 [Flavobacteriales bacterium]|nr:hypothetical protein [Flavobacteriales bacterium]
MNVSKKIVLSIFILLSNLPFDCISQPFISVSSGINSGKLFNLKSEYPSELKYRIKGGFSFSLALDSINRDKNLRLTLTYGQQNLGIYEESYDKWGAGGPSNYTIHFQYFQLDLAYKFQLVSNPRYSLNVFTGPSFSLSNKALLNGYGRRTTNTPILDSSGVWHPVYSTVDWVKENEKMTDFVKYNFGINLGLNFNYPISKNIDLILENKYTLLLRNTTNLGSYYHTFYILSGINFGARFRI